MKKKEKPTISILLKSCPKRKQYSATNQENKTLNLIVLGRDFSLKKGNVLVTEVILRFSPISREQSRIVRCWL